LPKAVHQNIVDKLKELGASLERLVKANHRLAVLQKEIQTFDEGQYPHSVKELKSNLSLIEFDNPYSLAVSGPHVFSVTIPQGTSRREAGSIIHKAFSKEWHILEAEAQTEAVEALTSQTKPMDTLDAIHKECMAMLAEPALPAQYGMQSPSPRFTDAQVAQVIANCYKRTYSNFEKLLRHRAAQDTIAKQKRQDAEIATTSKTPTQLFDDAVTAALNARLAELSLVDEPMPSDPTSSTSATANFLHSLPGNDLSPSGGVGHNIMVAKSKSKAKAKVAPRPSAWAEGEPSYRDSGWKRGKNGQYRGKRHQ